MATSRDWWFLLTKPKTRSQKRIHRVPSTFWSCSIVNDYASNTFMTIITNANRADPWKSHQVIEFVEGPTAADMVWTGLGRLF